MALEMPKKGPRDSDSFWLPVPPPRARGSRAQRDRTAKPPADLLPAAQAGRPEVKRKGKAEASGVWPALPRRTAAFSGPHPDVGFSPVARICVTWQPLAFVTGNAAALGRIRVVLERGYWDSWSLPPFLWLPPLVASLADNRALCRKHHGLSDHRQELLCPMG